MDDSLRFDLSSPRFRLDRAACILCDRCSRACAVVEHDVVHRAGKGAETRIVFGYGDPMAFSACVGCGALRVRVSHGGDNLPQTHFPRPDQGDRHMNTASTASLRNDRVVDESPTSSDVSFAQMEQSPHLLIQQLARDIGPKVLESLPNPPVRRRRLAAGQVLFRDGEFTSSFYLIESGTLGLYEGGFTPIIRRRSGLLRRCASGLRRLFGVSGGDPPRSLPLGGRMVRMAGPGEVAAEMACMNFYPHTESALALEDCVVLEVARVVLDHLPVGRFREAIETLYREHVVPNALCRSNLLAPLRESPDQREAVIADLVARRAVEVVRHGPDEVIFAQGTRADGLYSIHTGHVRVSIRRPGGEATVAYAGPLEFFGEVALLSDLLDVRTGDLPTSRVFTCRALDHVELLRIGPESLPLLPGCRAPRRHDHRAGSAPKSLRDPTIIGAESRVNPRSTRPGYPGPPGCATVATRLGQRASTARMNISPGSLCSRAPTRIMTICSDEDRCVFLRCYRNLLLGLVW